MWARLRRQAGRGRAQQPISQLGPGVDKGVHSVSRVSMPEEYIARVCVIGEVGIGKASISERFTKNQFSAARPNDEADASDLPRAWFAISRQIRRGVELNGNSIKVSVNTLNEKESESFWRMNRHCGGILLVYSVTDEHSFERLNWWIDEAKTHCEGDIPIVLVGNKCDEVSKTVVDFPTAWDFATEKNLPLVEVSAKDGTNVELAFMTLLSKMKLQLNLMLTSFAVR